MNEVSSKSTKRISKYKVIVLLSLLAIVIVLLDFGLGTAFLKLRGFPYSATLLAPYPWETPRDEQLKKLKGEAKQYRISVPSHHHDLKPLASWDGAWGPVRYTIKTSSLGFRDRAVREVPLKSDKKRVVFLGDSFTEGVGIEYEDTFVGIIDTELSAQNIEVLNAGVVSYSPVIYFAKTHHLLRDVGLKFNELVVFLDISDAYDEVNRYTVDSAGKIVDGQSKSLSSSGSGFSAFAKEYSVLTFLLTHTTELRRRSYPITGDPRALWTFDEQWFNDYGKEGLEKMAVNMTRLKELCDAEGVELTVAVYPYPDQVAAGKLEDHQQIFWSGWCKNKGVKFLNLYPKFVDENATPEARMELTKDCFFARDTHWNKRGHRVVADRYLAWRRESSAAPR